MLVHKTSQLHSVFLYVSDGERGQKNASTSLGFGAWLVSNLYAILLQAVSFRKMQTTLLK
jgi:hypothetical protein